MRSALVLVLVVILAGGTLYGVAKYRQAQPGTYACTTDALACPDGSYVGRRGPSCAFAPCTNGASLEGVLEKQGEGYRLLMAAPLGSSSQEVSYSLPLVVASTSSAESLLGKRVSLTGSFIEGNTLAVASITALPGDAADPTKTTIAVGATGFANGVRITLHKVSNDSRCASDVQCIQAGAVSAEVTLQSDTDKEEVTLVSGAKPTAFDSYHVSLVDVSPVPVSTKEIGITEYRLTFAVVSNR